RRSWRHLGDRERRAAADARDVRARARGRRQDFARAESQAAAAAPAPVRRGESDSGQVGARRDGADRTRRAPADDATSRALSRDGARGACRSRHRAAAASRGETRLRLPILAACAAIALASGGCKTTTDILEGKKVDYKSAGSLPPLEVPPDLTTPSRDNRYAVPETGKTSATLSGYQADRSQQAKLGNSAVLPNVDKMRIERAGTQRWLVVQEPPEKLWGLVKDFWLENGFLVQVEVAEAGVMETDWAENRAKIP